MGVSGMGEATRIIIPSKTIFSNFCLFNEFSNLHILPILLSFYTINFPLINLWSESKNRSTICNSFHCVSFPTKIQSHTALIFVDHLNVPHVQLNGFFCFGLKLLDKSLSPKDCIASAIPIVLLSLGFL